MSLNLSLEVLIALAGTAILLAAVTIWMVIRQRSPFEREIRKLTKAISDAHLSDLLVPDGMGGEIYVAHLLRTSEGFLLLDPRDVAGMVFAGDKMHEWSATHEGNRVAFENPIPALLDRLAAVRSIAGGAPVEARVLFSKRVTFPKGRPEIAITTADLMQEYAATTRGEYTIYAAEWQHLATQCQQ